MICLREKSNRCNVQEHLVIVQVVRCIQKTTVEKEICTVLNSMVIAKRKKVKDKVKEKAMKMAMIPARPNIHHWMETL